MHCRPQTKSITIEERNTVLLHIDTRKIMGECAPNAHIFAPLFEHEQRSPRSYPSDLQWMIPCKINLPRVNLVSKGSCALCSFRCRQVSGPRRTEKNTTVKPHKDARTHVSMSQVWFEPILPKFVAKTPNRQSLELCFFSGNWIAFQDTMYSNRWLSQGFRQIRGSHSLELRRDRASSLRYGKYQAWRQTK